MKKIFIIGISGSGKSTLAKKLSIILKIPSFDLDDILWIKKYSDKRSSKDCREKLKKLINENSFKSKIKLSKSTEEEYFLSLDEIYKISFSKS